MKKRNLFLFTFLFALVFVLGACFHDDTSGDSTPSDANISEDKQQDNMMDDVSKDSGDADVLNGHMGCQEDEVSLDGSCQVAENNNTSLFEQDLSDKVAGNDITVGGVSGYLAKPLPGGDLPASGELPGVVLIHEWWGLNDNIKEMARILANEGFVVFAVDLYGEKAATSSEGAREMATRVRNNQDQAVADMQVAATYLLENEEVSKIASMGWCFGGQQSLLLSLNQEMDATIIYYGQLTDDTDELQKLAGPVLGLFGGEDASISVESVNNFEMALDSVDIENEIYVYDGVGHAFANPSGSNYAPEETRDAWIKTVEFLNTNLK